MFELLKLLESLSSKYIVEERKFNHQYDIKEYYDLNKNSIFLHIGSGVGATCLHASLRSKCLSYGVEKDLNTV